MYIYQRFSDNMSFLERKIQDNSHPFSPKNPWHLELAVIIKLLFLKLSFILAKVVLVVIGNPTNNFCTFTKVGNEKVYLCSYSYREYKEYHNLTKKRAYVIVFVSVTIIALAFSLIFPGRPIGKAANYTWNQTDWSGGADVSNTLVHPQADNPAANLTEFYSKDPNVDVSTTGEIKLSTVSGTPITETSDTDFNAGTQGNTYVSSGSVVLMLPPAQGTGLTAASGTSSGSIVLNWSAPSSNGSAITGYKVYQGTSSGTETLLTTGGCASLGNVLTCTNSGLTNGTRYYYKVSAVNAIGEGILSSEKSAVPGFIYTTQCAGINIYYADLGTTYQWKTANTACSTPQCGQNGAQDGDTLVDPATNPSVDFSAYPAQDACKAIDGRLPSRTELSCIYTNRASMGSFQTDVYWSNAEAYYGGSQAYAFRFSDAVEIAGFRDVFYYVRCVRTK